MVAQAQHRPIKAHGTVRTRPAQTDSRGSCAPPTGSKGRRWHGPCSGKRGMHRASCRTVGFGFVPTLTFALLLACASKPLPSPAAPVTESRSEPPTAWGDDELAKAECQIAPDCMRVRGNPPAGLHWKCHVGICSVDFPPEAME